MLSNFPLVVVQGLITCDRPTTLINQAESTLRAAKEDVEGRGKGRTCHPTHQRE